MITDRVGDFIIRLQNAAAIGQKEVMLPYSAHLSAIASKLKDLGFVDSVEAREKEGSPRRELVVGLVYENGSPRLRGVKRISKPGRRLYAPSTKAHSVKGGTGARIFSTPSGILSDREARTQRVGGEELFEIW